MNTQPHKLVLSALALAVASPRPARPTDIRAAREQRQARAGHGRLRLRDRRRLGVANNPALMSTFDAKTFQLNVTAIDLKFEFAGSGIAAAGSRCSSQGSDGAPAA